MSIADPKTYLAGLSEDLRRHWPDNRLVNIVCHGHSVPAGYFATPMVDSFNAYPHLLHATLKARFPFAVINVIVTAIGGENSEAGSRRFATEVLCHRPRVLTIDYALNDRRLSPDAAEHNWRTMIEQALQQNCRLILCTPTPDRTGITPGDTHQWQVLQLFAEQIRSLAREYGLGLADSLAAFEHQMALGTDLNNLLSWGNHPNRQGHELVVRELAKWFPA